MVVREEICSTRIFITKSGAQFSDALALGALCNSDILQQLHKCKFSRGLDVSSLAPSHRQKAVLAAKASVQQHEAFTFPQVEIDGNVLTCLASFLFISYMKKSLSLPTPQLSPSLFIPPFNPFLFFLPQVFIQLIFPYLKFTTLER